MRLHCSSTSSILCSSSPLPVVLHCSYSAPQCSAVHLLFLMPTPLPVVLLQSLDLVLCHTFPLRTAMRVPSLKLNLSPRQYVLTPLDSELVFCSTNKQPQFTPAVSPVLLAPCCSVADFAAPIIPCPPRFSLTSAGCIRCVRISPPPTPHNPAASYLRFCPVCTLVLLP